MNGTGIAPEAGSLLTDLVTPAEFAPIEESAPEAEPPAVLVTAPEIPPVMAEPAPRWVLPRLPFAALFPGVSAVRVVSLPGPLTVAAPVVGPALWTELIALGPL